MYKQVGLVTTGAVKAGVGEMTARRFLGRGKLPSELRLPYTWRTREDPFAEA
ncbi:MAG: hypothetical protein OXU68_01755 [Bacteroidota bacterium]|nr:hypothetical protein [Bacteroidota bacterium]